MINTVYSSVLGMPIFTTKGKYLWNLKFVDDAFLQKKEEKRTRGG